MPADTEYKEESRGKGFPQILHDRARTAAVELHKLLLSLSTGAVAVFFIAITTKIEPVLTFCQRVCLLLGLLSMGFAVLEGIISWHADSQRNYFWALSLQKEEKEEKKENYKKRDKYLACERVAANFLVGSFLMGMLFSSVYIALRIFSI